LGHHRSGHNGRFTFVLFCRAFCRRRQETSLPVVIKANLSFVGESHCAFSSSALSFLTTSGKRLTANSGDLRETSYSFQRLSIITQRFDSVLTADEQILPFQVSISATCLYLSKSLLSTVSRGRSNSNRFPLLADTRWNSELSFQKPYIKHCFLMENEATRSHSSRPKPLQRINIPGIYLREIKKRYVSCTGNRHPIPGIVHRQSL